MPVILLKFFVNGSAKKPSGTSNQNLPSGDVYFLLLHVLWHFRHDSTKISGPEDWRDGSQHLPPLAGSFSALPAESTGSQNVSTGFT
jgi:hypothetical protein